MRELEHAREAIRQTFEKEKQRIESERADLPNALKRDQDRVRESLRKKVFALLEGEQKRSYQGEQDEARAALGNVQAQYIATMIAQPIPDATIDGVGASMKSRLVAAGIVTAGDVSPAAVASVSGFGEARVMSVVAWRERVQQGAQRTMPQTLPDADQQDITARHHAERADIERRSRRQKRTRKTSYRRGRTGMLHVLLHLMLNWRRRRSRIRPTPRTTKTPSRARF